jgi:hypothetical protein
MTQPIKCLWCGREMEEVIHRTPSVIRVCSCKDTSPEMDILKVRYRNGMWCLFGDQKEYTAAEFERLAKVKWCL